MAMISTVVIRLEQVAAFTASLRSWKDKMIGSYQKLEGAKVTHDRDGSGSGNIFSGADNHEIIDSSCGDYGGDGVDHAASFDGGGAEARCGSDIVVAVIIPWW